MAKSKYVKDPMKNTRPFFTFLKKIGSDPAFLSDCCEMKNLAETIIGNKGIVFTNHHPNGCLFMIRCTPKAYDDIRKAFECINPDICDYDIKLNEYEF